MSFTRIPEESQSRECGDLTLYEDVKGRKKEVKGEKETEPCHMSQLACDRKRKKRTELLFSTSRPKLKLRFGSGEASGWGFGQSY